MLLFPWTYEFDDLAYSLEYFEVCLNFAGEVFDLFVQEEVFQHVGDEDLDDFQFEVFQHYLIQDRSILDGLEGLLELADSFQSELTPLLVVGVVLAKCFVFDTHVRGTT